VASLKVTLARSVIGMQRLKNIHAQIQSRGKRESFVIKEDTPQLRGMIEKVKHLVTVEQV